MDVRDWLKIEALLSIFTGLPLFFAPSFVLKFVVAVDGEGVSWHLARCLGAQIFAEGVFAFLISRSKHEAPHTSFLLNRALMSVFCIASLWYAKRFHAAFFQPMILSGALLCSVICLCISVFLIIRTKCPLGTRLFSTDNLFNGLVLLDACAALIIGCMWMCFPDWILARQVRVELTGVHVLLGRCLGAIFLASSVISQQALYWPNASDRRNCCYGRTLMCLGVFAAQLWSQLAYGQWWTGGHWVGIGLYSIWTVSSLLVARGHVKGKFA